MEYSLIRKRPRQFNFNNTSASDSHPIYLKSIFFLQSPACPGHSSQAWFACPVLCNLHFLDTCTSDRQGQWHFFCGSSRGGCIKGALTCVLSTFSPTREVDCQRTKVRDCVRMEKTHSSRFVALMLFSLLLSRPIFICLLNMWNRITYDCCIINVTWNFGNIWQT